MPAVIGALECAGKEAQSFNYRPTTVQMPFDIKTDGPSRVLYLDWWMIFLAASISEVSCLLAKVDEHRFSQMIRTLPITYSGLA